MFVTTYELADMDFRPWACEVLGVDRLEDLHHRPDPAVFGTYVDRLNHYCGLLNSEFHRVDAVYQALVAFVSDLVGGLELRQRPPSFRCHLPGGGTASAFHRDGDPKYGITPGTINVWVPLTRVRDTNTLFVETAPGSQDLRPVELDPGQLMIFDAYHLLHGSYANTTECTRVSLDFRFLPHDRDRIDELGIPADQQKSSGVPS